MATQSELLDLLRTVFKESLPHRGLPADDAPLFGKDGALDSIDLVSFVTDAEEEINDAHDAEIVLASTRALSRSKSPFRSLSALAEYCQEQLEAA
jgi:acyl carrier protein